MNTEFLVKFRTNIHVSAAILDWWVGVKKKCLCCFVGNSYTYTVTKAFHQFAIGYEAAPKRSAPVVILPMENRKVNVNFFHTHGCRAFDSTGSRLSRTCAGFRKSDELS
jgi:hypothetical protein